MNPRSVCDEFEYIQVHIFLATAMPLFHCHSTAICLLCLDFDKASISFFDFAGEAIMRPTGQNHKDKSSHGTEREFGGTLGETITITSSLYIRGWIINLSRYCESVMCGPWSWHCPALLHCLCLSATKGMFMYLPLHFLDDAIYVYFSWGSRVESYRFMSWSSFSRVGPYYIFALKN